MIVRIQLRRGPRIQRNQRKNRRLALAVAALLIPAALMAYVLGIWRLASDMGMAGEFTINGLFSHWQMWIAVAVILHLASYLLNRYGKGDDVHLPEIVTPKLGSNPRPLEPPPQSQARKAGSR